MSALKKSWQNGHLAGWMLLSLLALTFLLGGGSRGDIDSLIVLRPIAFLFLGIGIFMLDRETIRRFLARPAVVRGLDDYCSHPTFAAAPFPMGKLAWA